MGIAMFLCFHHAIRKLLKTGARLCGIIRL